MAYKGTSSRADQSCVEICDEGDLLSVLLQEELFIYLCLNVAKRNETKDKWFLEFPSTSAFVGSVF